MSMKNVCFIVVTILVLCSACSSNPTLAPSSASTTVVESIAEPSVELKDRDLSEKPPTIGLETSTPEPTVIADSESSTDDTEEKKTTSIQVDDESSNADVVLPDAIQAYFEYENAKSRDNQLFYDELMIEALKSIDYGFTSGKVGTEEFEYAVKLIVPDNVYLASHDAGDVDGKMMAIHDYCDGDPVFADWFTVNESNGELSIAMDNIEAFIEDAISAGAFVGDISNFVLNDQVTDLSGFVSLMNQNLAGQGVTESTVLAMLSVMEDYDGTWDNILDDLSVPALSEIN